MDFVLGLILGVRTWGICFTADRIHVWSSSSILIRMYFQFLVSTSTLLCCWFYVTLKRFEVAAFYWVVGDCHLDYPIRLSSIKCDSLVVVKSNVSLLY